MRGRNGREKGCAVEAVLREVAVIASDLLELMAIEGMTLSELKVIERRDL